MGGLISKIFPNRRFSLTKRPQITRDTEKIKEGTQGKSENFVGRYFPFQNQSIARKKYLKLILDQFERWKSRENEDPLKIVRFPVCCGAGGIGKTTFVQKSLQKEYETSLEDGTKALLRSCLGTACGELIFRISFTTEGLTELDYNRVEQSVALRLLHQFLDESIPFR